MKNNYFDINKGVELLAPAGSFEVFKAVLAAGADAVYLGGRMFGARAYAGNLEDSELLRAIDYAHIHGKKLYLTVNTLVKNTEFSELYNYLRPLYEAGLDAVIVQDYGVMSFVDEYFPGLDMHASTQMTVTHPDYIDFLRKYNVTRVVPARELSIEEIRTLHNYDSDMELECFIHGALCYAYSGQCLMSSFLGGRSGNRGRCAGTCRLMYEAAGDKRALLSLKDLCTLEILPDILEAGVYSLKIEGRMKSAVYAAGVTSIYRKYVDMYKSEGREEYRVDDEDIRRLLMLFYRGGMTKGYYVMHNGAGMVADTVKSDKSQSEKAEYENLIKSQYVGKNLKEKINVSVKLFQGERAILSVADKAGNSAAVTGDEVMPARNKPLSDEDIVKQIGKFGNTDYEPENIDIQSGSNIFMPNQALNELRRQAVRALNDVSLAAFRRTGAKYFCADDSGKKHGAVSSDTGASRRRISVRATTYEQALAALESGIDRICIETELLGIDEIAKIRKLCGEKNIECTIAMPRVMRHGQCSFIEDSTEYFRNLDFDGFLIRNAAEYEYLQKMGFKGHFIADYTMYAFNDRAVRALEACGFDTIVYPIELNAKELYYLDVAAETELIVYMRTPLMISAGCIDKTGGRCHKPDSSFGVIKDRKNATLKYMSCCRYCYNIIYNSVPTVLTDKLAEIGRIAPDYLGLAFADEDARTVADVVEAARIAGQIDSVQSAGFTRGHFTHGVE